MSIKRITKKALFCFMVCSHLPALAAAEPADRTKKAEQKGIIHISSGVQEKLLEQYSLELQSERQYRTLALWARNEKLPGIANWFEKQATEEYEHASWVDNHLRRAGVHIKRLPVMEETDVSVKSIRDAFQYSLSMERKLSRNIIALRDLALEQKNEYTVHFMNTKMIPEQIEEEESIQQTLDKIDRYLEDGNTVELDRELGARK